SGTDQAGRVRPRRLLAHRRIRGAPAARSTTAPARAEIGISHLSPRGFFRRMADEGDVLSALDVSRRWRAGSDDSRPADDDSRKLRRATPRDSPEAIAQADAFSHRG